MPRILGVDPGSRKTGYGIIDYHAGKTHYVSSGVIKTDSTSDLAERLKVIFTSLCELIDGHQPEEFAIESVFLAKNANSALKLGQARGAAIVAAVKHDLVVTEYEARKIKQSVVGSGSADKFQVQHMVKSLLGLSRSPQEDAADALAVAICHANTQKYLVSIAGKRYRRGRVLS